MPLPPSAQTGRAPAILLKQVAKFDAPIEVLFERIPNMVTDLIEENGLDYTDVEVIVTMRLSMGSASQRKTESVPGNE